MEQSNLLDDPITVEELFKALLDMPNNKSPGPNGYPAEFYKHFWDILSSLLHRLVIDAQKKYLLYQNTWIQLVLLFYWNPKKTQSIHLATTLFLLSTHISKLVLKH